MLTFRKREKRNECESQPYAFAGPGRLESVCFDN